MRGASPPQASFYRIHWHLQLRSAQEQRTPQALDAGECFPVGNESGAWIHGAETVQLDQGLFNQRISTALKLVLKTCRNGADQGTIHPKQQLIPLLRGWLTVQLASQAEVKKLFPEQRQAFLQLEMPLQTKLSVEFKPHQIATHTTAYGFDQCLLKPGQIGIAVEGHGDPVPAQTARGFHHDRWRLGPLHINHENL
jgi:hypothetical protein